jgi:hypothetical protein
VAPGMPERPDRTKGPLHEPHPGWSQRALSNVAEVNSRERIVTRTTVTHSRVFGDPLCCIHDTGGLSADDRFHLGAAFCPAGAQIANAVARESIARSARMLDSSSRCPSWSEAGRHGDRARAPTLLRGPPYAGLMFWFRWKKFVGS